MALQVINRRGVRVVEPVTGNHPDEDAGPPVCGFCGDVEVSGEGETCAACLAQQEEKAAENDDPGAHYADLQNDQDRLDGVA